MLKLFKDLRHEVFYRAILRKDVEIVTMGNVSTGCHWTFFPKGLSKTSIVYSGGVGRDVSFDHELADRFGCSIWLFDPSATGLETMSLKENARPEFHFVPLGISGRDETLHLAPPRNMEEGSWFAASGASEGAVSVECHSLGRIMRDLGHDHIDLLKLDIEGPEYEVLDDLLTQRLDVRQICVEYHHGMLPGITRSQTIRSLLRVLRSGYCLIDKVGNNHTFLRRDQLG